MKFLSYRLYFTGAITLAIWALLIWNHYHGGVASHHLLHRKDLPEISDWWSGLLIPLLTFFLTYRIQKRLGLNDKSDFPKVARNAFYRFLAALSYGVVISLLFYLGYSKITGYLFNLILLIALFFPIYRAECLLGFVLGLTLTFGAFISTIAGIAFIIIGLILYLYVRRGIIFLVKKSINLRGN